MYQVKTCVHTPQGNMSFQYTMDVCCGEVVLLFFRLAILKCLKSYMMVTQESLEVKDWPGAWCGGQELGMVARNLQRPGGEGERMSDMSGEPKLGS